MLFQSAQPMSDVPATACWLAALLLAGTPGPTRAAAAGAVASLAILIRPNLAPLAIAPLAMVAWLAPDARARVRHTALFVAAATPAAAALAWIQNVRYGSPLASGYGSISTLFSWDHIAPNLRQYPKWLTDTQTPFVWFCGLAPLALAGSSRSARALGWSALLVVAALFALYLPYAAFKRHEWTYLRFLLPAIPLMLLLATRATLVFARQLGPSARAPLVIVFFGAILVYCAQTAERRHAFELRPGEQRYAEAGAFVRRRLPPNAIVLAGQHSGSVRLYGERPILRFDLLQPEDLDRAIATLRANGFMPFMVVDPWERSVFYQRFSVPRQTTLAAVRLVREISGVQIYAID
jgi:4-amino-4-deoxy-L-arabinose transferase-like glycosyltransferase